MPRLLDYERVECSQELATRSQRRGGVLPAAGLASRERDDGLSGPSERIGARSSRHHLRRVLGELHEGVMVFHESGSAVRHTSRCRRKRSGRGPALA